MPLDKMKKDSDSRITVLCSVCGDVVDEEQLENGRAVCGYCDESIFDTPPKKGPVTVKEIMRETKAEEEKQFLRMMKYMFRRTRM